MLLSVGQLAKLTGLTIRALHHYDAIGLLAPSHRSDAGYRLYSQADVIRLYRIQALQRVGLSLAEIESALASDTNSLDELVSRQLAQLDEQIARSTVLRAQLQLLQSQLKEGIPPSADVWLSTLEMIGLYDRHCSPEELKKLITHRNDAIDEWRVLIQDIRTHMDSGASAEDAQSHELARRWMCLVLQRTGGDAGLAQKMKRAFYDDEAVQSRMQTERGFDKAMLDFLLASGKSAHRAVWARHFLQSDVNRLRFTGSWASGWFALSTVVRDEMGKGAAPTSTAFVALSRQWRALIRDFADEDARLESEVHKALKTDSDIQAFWNVEPELIAWVTSHDQ